MSANQALQAPVPGPIMRPLDPMAMEADLVRALMVGEQMVSLTDEVRSRRTRLLDRIAALLVRNNARIIRIVGADEKPLTLKTMMAQVLDGLPADDTTDRVAIFLEALTMPRGDERHLVLIIDDAHLLTSDALNYLSLIGLAPEPGALPLRILFAGPMSMWDRLPRGRVGGTDSFTKRLVVSRTDPAAHPAPYGRNVMPFSQRVGTGSHFAGPKAAATPVATKVIEEISSRNLASRLSVPTQGPAPSILEPTRETRRYKGRRLFGLTIIVAAGGTVVWQQPGILQTSDPHLHAEWEQPAAAAQAPPFTAPGISSFATDTTPVPFRVPAPYPGKIAGSSDLSQRPDVSAAPEAVKPRPIESGTGSAAAAIPPPAAPNAVLSNQIVEALVARGDALLALRDVAAARLVYTRAAAAGSARAAAALGMTYDPRFLAQIDLPGVTSDRAAAAVWYRRAVALGDPDAAMLMQRLGDAGQ